MNALEILMIAIAVQYCYGHKIDAETQTKRVTVNKSHRELEPHTSVFLDGELYSLAPVSTHPKNKTKPLRRKNSHASFKGSKSEQWHDAAMIGPSHKLSLAENTEKGLEGIRPVKHAPSRNKSSHKKEKTNKFNKRLQRRHFTGHKVNYRKTRQQDVLGYTYRPASAPPVPNPANYNFRGEVTENLSSTPRYVDQKTSTGSSFSLYEKPYQANWANTNYTNPEASVYENKTLPDELKSPNSKRNIFPGHPDNRNYDGQDGNVIGSYRDSTRPPGDYVGPSEAAGVVSWTTTTVSTPSLMSFQRASISQRNLPVNRQSPKGEKNEQDDDVKPDETESDDAVIHFGVACDQVVNQTCWMQREVGDVLTLSVRIESAKKSSSFQVRWMKVFHVYGGNKRKPLEIESGKLPWNMVSGSEGRELRLNPVTNTDMDPNCIVAKVFLLAKHRGKTLYTQLKKLIFRIDSPIIDMGKLYAGEELTINIENFISLPERGNLLLDWCLETKPHQYQSLPSNVKVSGSGRSLVLKELKKGRMGVLNCVIYSSNRFAVAKRRFNILKIAENIKRRSSGTNLKDDRTATSDLKGNRLCRHVIRRSQEMAIQRFEEGKKPKSRKKRFRRMESDIDGQAEKDCEYLRRKVYSRFVRSLFGQSTTEDPRILPLEQLLELSEEGDGTLDDQIPHEVHYVAPQIKLLPGTSMDKLQQFSSSANCTSNGDCGKHATCIRFKGRINSTDGLGYCNCRPEFYGDGYACRKIPLSNHREKRLRRNVAKDFAVAKHLFYERPQAVLPASTTTEFGEEDEGLEGPPKVLAFEEEESFLLSDCIDDKDCSAHASCIQPSEGHPYCRCRPGFRGNGIFCWETMDYVPPEEHLFAGDEISDATDSTDPVRDHLEAVRIAAPDGLEDASEG